MSTSIKALLESKNIKEIVHVLPETTVMEALSVMQQYNVGALLVIENDELVGIFSERDYARKGILMGRNAKTTYMSEVMTSNVFTVEDNFNIIDCMEIMSNKKIRHLPVTHKGKTVGVLSIGDIVTELIKEQKLHINYLEDYIKGS